jgi:hypothetical protein
MGVRERAPRRHFSVHIAGQPRKKLAIVPARPVPARVTLVPLLGIHRIDSNFSQKSDALHRGRPAPPSSATQSPQPHPINSTETRLQRVRKRALVLQQSPLQDLTPPHPAEPRIRFDVKRKLMSRWLAEHGGDKGPLPPIGSAKYPPFADAPGIYVLKK